MGAAQNLNTAILTHRTVRSYRDIKLGRSVFQTFQRVATLEMATPGEEGRTTLATRDATVTVDTSIGGRSGLPIVRYERALTSYDTAVTSVSGLNFPIRVGQDKFLENTDAAVTNDLHADVLAV